jgi:uncharacterized protein YqcC (DUF446 family)
MAWRSEYIAIQDEMRAHLFWVWITAPDLARMMGWTESKTRYWVDKMVKDYWLIWRWHPQRHGWLATRQYALPHNAKGK